MSKSTKNKRPLLRLSLFALGAMALLLAAGLFLLSQQRYALATINWAAREFGNVELVWVKPELDLWRARAAAGELHVVSEGVALVSVYDVKAQTRVQDILTLNLENSVLKGRATVLYLPVGSESTDAGTADVLSYLGFLPQKLELDAGHVVVDGDPVWLFQLDGIGGQRLSSDSYRLETSAIHAGDALDLELELQAVVSDEVATAVNFEALFRAEDSDSEVSLSGELAARGAGLFFDLQMTSAYGDVGVFLRGLDAPEQLDGSLVLNGRLRGDTTKLHLSELDARLDNGEAYHFAVTGEAEYSLEGSSQLALSASGRLASVQALLPELDLGPGHFGDVSASIELRGSLEEPVIDAFRLDTRSESGLLLGLSGRLGSLEQVAEREGLNQLSLDASAASLAALEPWLGELPWDLGQWRASFELQEVGDVIALDDVLIVAGDEQGLAVNARGRVANVARVIEEEVEGLQGVDLEMGLSAADAEALARWFDYPALAGHSVAAKLSLQGDGRFLEGTGGTLELRGEGLSLQAENIEVAIDLLAEDPVTRAVAPLRVDAKDVAHLGRYIDTELPDLGPLKARLELAYSEGVLDARSIELHGAESAAELGFDLSGGAKDLLGSPTLKLDGRLELKDPALLESLSGLRMSAGEGRVALSVDERRAKLEGELRMGETPLALAVAARLGDEGLKGLDLALSSKRLRLVDLGLQSQAVEDEAYSPAERIGEQGQDLSLAPVLEAVPEYPVSLRLRADQIQGENTEVQDFALDAESRGDRLTLRRLVARSGQASIEYMGVIDRGQDPVALSLAGQAFGVPTGMITSDLGVDTDFAGTLSASTGITAYGRSGEALLQSLDGHFTFAVKDAVIEGAAYDVLATDLLGWIYKGAAMETETRIDCGMADFTLLGGVAISDRLYVETDRMLASGTAEFDLVKEYLDVTLTPLSKSRAFQVPSAVRLKGPFTDPQPEISPFSAAADAYAAWLTLVPQITLEIFGYKGKAGKQQQPCRIWGGDEEEEEG